MTTIDRIHSVTARLRFALVAILASMWIVGDARGVTSTDQISIIAQDQSVPENGGGSARFTISRNGGISGNLTVFIDVNGTAKPGAAASPPGTLNPNRYLTIPGSVVIPDGKSSVDVILQPFDDDQVEGGQTVIISIINGPGYIVGTPFVAQIIIQDDELRATMRVPDLVCIEPLAQPPGTDPDPFNVAVIRAEFNPFPVPFNRSLDVVFGGTATPGVDYDLQIVYGHDIPVGSGSGTLLDSGRRALFSQVVNGVSIEPPAAEPKGFFKGDLSIEATNSISRNGGAGIFEVDDVITFEGFTGLYVVTSVAAGTTPGTTKLGISPPLEANLEDVKKVLTAIPTPMLGFDRLSVSLPAAYRHVEYEIFPLTDALVEGAETVVLSLVESPDYLSRDPTVATAYIADNNSRATIDLVSNTIEGGANGVFRVSISAPFKKDILVPFAITGGTAVAGTDYTMTGLDNTTLLGSIVIPAGQSTGDISVLAISDALPEGIETVTITLEDSLDYVMVSTPGSTTNPSATMNIADSTTPITIIPTPPVTTGSGTSTPTAPVRTLPTSSSGKGCGIGSGSVGFVVLAITLLRLSLRRQRHA